MDRSLMLSIDILTVPTDEAVREIQNKLLGVETNAANWQRKKNAANNFSAVLPYDMGPVSYTHLDVYKRQVEGDIKGFFDNIDHNVMIGILRKRIKDERFLRLTRGRSPVYRAGDQTDFH